MSYLRGPWYTWSDGEQMHCDWDDTAIPLDVFEALCVMVAAEILVDEGVQGFLARCRKADELGGGNIGCDAASLMAGERGFDERLRALLTRPGTDETSVSSAGGAE
jgi:hypothetical protein